VGIFSFLVLTLLAATGTVIGFEDQLAPLIYKLTCAWRIVISPMIPQDFPSCADGSNTAVPHSIISNKPTHYPLAVVQHPRV